MQPETPTAAEWDARVDAWQRRVEKLGVGRAVYHKKHTVATFPVITDMQHRAIWPHLMGNLDGTERRALDFGCGIGRWTVQLAELVGYALGVDQTPELLEYAQEHPAPPAAGCVEWGLYLRGHIPADDQSFDLLWCCMVLSTVLEERMFRATLTELRRVLRPGALIVLTDNTSREDGRQIRSGDSMSRTVEEYEAAFDWAGLRRVGQYIDWHEINSIFVGRVHA